MSPSLEVELAGGAAETATTYFDDELRCPAHVADVADALATIAGDETPDLLHVAGPDVTSRADLARRFAAHLGLDATRIRTGTIADSGDVSTAPRGEGGAEIEWAFEMPLLVRHLADDLRTFYHEAIAAFIERRPPRWNR